MRLKLPVTQLPPSAIWAFWLLLWLALNGVQAAFTNLTFDEAYYWLYSRHLDWGYFDHPPMTALLARLGDPVGAAFGLRLGTILAQGVALWALWRTLARFSAPRPPAHVFFLIAFAIPIFQVYGFIATPDGPLLLFSALFLYLYQAYLEKPGMGIALLLGAVVAALFYSKYHGLLLVLLVLLSNLRLLLRPQVYIAMFVALLLFAPHLYWQARHDWISVKFHLVERTAAFKGRFVQEYLLNLLLIYNPVYLYPLYRIFRKGWKNDFERALYFISFGFVLFFGISSLRGHVQPQWTAIVALPLILLLNRVYSLEPGLRRWIYAGFWAFLPLYIVARLVIAREVLPRELEFFEQGDVAETLDRFSRQSDIPVLFDSNYRYTSAYAFYTRDARAHSVRGIRRRRTQFDIWGFEEYYHNRDVWFLTRKNARAVQLKTPKGRQLYLNRIEKYQACDRVELTLLSLAPETKYTGRTGLEAGRHFSADLLLKNPYLFDLYLAPRGPLTITGAVLVPNATYPLLLTGTDFEPVVLKAGENKSLRLRARLPIGLLPLETWEIGFSLQQDKTVEHPLSNVLKTK